MSEDASTRLFQLPEQRWAPPTTTIAASTLDSGGLWYADGTWIKRWELRGPARYTPLEARAERVWPTEDGVWTVTRDAFVRWVHAADRWNVAARIPRPELGYPSTRPVAFAQRGLSIVFDQDGKYTWLPRPHEPLRTLAGVRLANASVSPNGTCCALLGLDLDQNLPKLLTASLEGVSVVREDVPKRVTNVYALEGGDVLLFGRGECLRLDAGVAKPRWHRTGTAPGTAWLAADGRTGIFVHEKNEWVLFFSAETGEELQRWWHTHDGFSLERPPTPWEERLEAPVVAADGSWVACLRRHEFFVLGRDGVQRYASRLSEVRIEHVAWSAAEAQLFSWENPSRMVDSWNLITRAHTAGFELTLLDPATPIARVDPAERAAVSFAEAALQSVQPSPDGRWCLLGFSELGVHQSFVYDREKETWSGLIPEARRNALATAWRPDGREVLYALDNQDRGEVDWGAPIREVELRALSVDDGTTRTLGVFPWAMTGWPKNLLSVHRQVAVLFDGATAHGISLDNGRLLWTFSLPEVPESQFLRSVFWSELDATLLYQCGAEVGCIRPPDPVRLWQRTLDGEMLRRRAPDGRTFLTTSAHAILRRATRDGAVVSTVGHPWDPRGTRGVLELSPDGRWVVTVASGVAEVLELPRIDL